MDEPAIDELFARWTEELAVVADIGEAGWVPLAAAEQAAGVSRSTLRAWYRGGQIPSRLMPGPHGMQRLVPLDAVVARAARSPRPRPPAAAEGPPAGETVATAALAAATHGPATAGAAAVGARPRAAADSDVVRLAELAVGEARTRAEQAERRAEAAEAALRAALERAAAAEAEVRILRTGR